MPKIVRAKKPSVTPPPAPPAPPRITAPRVPPEIRNKSKVLLTVADGKIDWQNMTPESRRQFEQMFSDPKFLAQFGLSAKKMGWQPDQVKHIYDGLGMLNQTIAALFLRWPAAAVQVLGFTNEEKDLLAEPTAELANRYSTEFLQRHQALAVWGACFMGVMQSKMMKAGTIAKQEQARELEKKKAAAGIAPAPTGKTPRSPLAETADRLRHTAEKLRQTAEEIPRTRVIATASPAPPPPTNGEAIGISLEDLPDPAGLAGELSLEDEIAGPIA
jgi:hypothetical protein